MAAGTYIAPLTNSQKLFLQRLLVSHVLTEESAQQLYASIKETFKDVAPVVEDDEDDDEDDNNNNGDQGYMGNNLAHCLGIINASLVPAFNLEVCTVSLPPPYKIQKNNDTQSLSQDNGGGKKRAALTKYHAIVNRSNDNVAQSHAFPLSKGGPHEMAYFRLIIEKIVENGLELLEAGGGGSNGAAVGCPGALNRMELINLRTEMEGNHKDKLNIAQVENALDLMENEGWLVRVAPPDEDDDDDDDSDKEDGDSDDEDGGGKKKRKRKKKRASSDGRRKSLKGTFYGIGPRSFMELGDFLQKVGLPADRMPQSILHRV